MKALITGASRGIGNSIASELAMKGWHLTLIASGERDLFSFANELKQKHSQTSINCIVCDLKNPLERQRIFKEIDFNDGLDLLVNNVGIYKENNSSETSYKELRETLEINLFAAIELSQQLLPFLMKSNSATIVNIGSVMSINAAAFASNYSISKHALKAWTDALREELRVHKVKVCGIYPGAVNTSSWDEGIENKENMIQPEDLAKLIALLPSLGKSTLVEEIRVSPLNF